MPPRVPLLQCLRSQPCSASSSTSTFLRTFSTTPAPQKRLRKSQQAAADPYAEAYRKAVGNVRVRIRQDGTLETAGDPVRGEETEFLKSLDSVGANDAEWPYELPYIRKEVAKGAISKTQIGQQAARNFGVTENDLEAVQQKVAALNQHSVADLKPIEDFADESEMSGEEQLKQLREKRESLAREDEERAEEAIKRIMGLDMGDAKDLRRLNVQRCVARFGRHNTDSILAPRVWHDQEAPPPADKRGGPDTGSSEVQIAVLTTKIRKLDQMLGDKNRDKHNKRNLRTLVHRRAKLLQYLRRKEKGGPRWQHLMDTLGLTEAAWKGEIVV